MTWIDMKVMNTLPLLGERFIRCADVLSISKAGAKVFFSFTVALRSYYYYYRTSTK